MKLAKVTKLLLSAFQKSSASCADFNSSVDATEEFSWVLLLNKMMQPSCITIVSLKAFSQKFARAYAEIALLLSLLLERPWTFLSLFISACCWHTNMSNSIHQTTLHLVLIFWQRSEIHIFSRCNAYLLLFPHAVTIGPRHSLHLGKLTLAQQAATASLPCQAPRLRPARCVALDGELSFFFWWWGGERVSGISKGEKK